MTTQPQHQIQFTAPELPPWFNSEPPLDVTSPVTIEDVMAAIAFQDKTRAWVQNGMGLEQLVANRTDGRSGASSTSQSADSRHVTRPVHYFGSHTVLTPTTDYLRHQTPHGVPTTLDQIAASLVNMQSQNEVLQRQLAGINKTVLGLATKTDLKNVGASVTNTLADLAKKSEVDEMVKTTVNQAQQELNVSINSAVVPLAKAVELEDVLNVATDIRKRLISVERIQRVQINHTRSSEPWLAIPDKDGRSPAGLEHHGVMLPLLQSAADVDRLSLKEIFAYCNFYGLPCEPVPGRTTQNSGWDQAYIASRVTTIRDFISSFNAPEFNVTL
ncbi:hypothetical protein FRC07_003803 [Ceratobasidium sp. 392]|nr:hypothetical protein FRC07_003803 [Ceratobasidium sp. 392]